MPLITESIGLLAATCTTMAFVPQAIKVIRTRNTAGLSLSMYVCFTIGVSLWLVYGCLLGDTAIIVANAITIVFAAIILALKLLYS
ncbi:MAG: SemiSWEET transporter [bacterium]|jgi:MtN3 and saliva related transmembrane protein|nr:SemiSWEET transporter [bacterium]